jgi:hypothetical protein
LGRGPAPTLALLLCGALGLAGACDKKERQVAPAPGGLPPLSARGNTGTQPTQAAPAMPADHPPILQPSSPHPTTAAPAAPAAAPAAAAPGAGNVEGVLRGSLVLDPKLKDKAKPGAVIFLSARAAQNGAPAGPPLAVKRLTVGSWPLPFELSPADAMMPGLTLRGQVVLMARIDGDEDAMTKQPGDIEGLLVATVPATAVELRLDKVRTEAAGSPSPPGLGAGMGGGMGDVHAPSPH